jgi:hypothetical protein
MLGGDDCPWATGEDLVRIEMSGTQLGGRGRIDGQDAEGRWAIGLAVTFLGIQRRRGGIAPAGNQWRYI